MDITVATMSKASSSISPGAFAMTQPQVLGLMKQIVENDPKDREREAVLCTIYAPRDANDPGMCSAERLKLDDVLDPANSSTFNALLLKSDPTLLQRLHTYDRNAEVILTALIAHDGDDTSKNCMQTGAIPISVVRERTRHLVRKKK